MRCWIAPRDVLPGMDWGGSIIDAIGASRIMVLVYSAKANDSPQIKREVERAVNRGMAVIPFRIEDVPMSKTLEYFISTPHWLDALTPPLQQHLDRLADTTRMILEQEGVLLPTPPAGQTAGAPPGLAAKGLPMPRPSKKQAAFAGGAVAILALAVGGVILLNRPASSGEAAARPAQVTRIAGRTPAAGTSPAPARGAVQAAATDRAAGSPAPAATPIPLPAMVGQRATYCLQNVNFTMEVVRAELARRLGGTNAPTQVSWLVLLMDITAQGSGGFTNLLSAESFAGMEVRDDQGRIYRPAQAAISSAAAQVYGGRYTFTSLPPGVPTRFVHAFEVPRNAPPLIFVGGRSGCS